MIDQDQTAVTAIFIADSQWPGKLQMKKFCPLDKVIRSLPEVYVLARAGVLQLLYPALSTATTLWNLGL